MSETVEATAPETPDGDDLDAVLHRAFDEADALTNNPAGMARDERGRFTAPEATEDTPAAERAPTQPDQPEDEGPKPPSSWSDTGSVKWSDLTPEVRDVIVQRERDREQIAREREELEKTVSPLQEVLRPYESKHAMAGLSNAEAVRRVLAAQEMLERDFLGTLPALIQQFGYNPQAVAQAMLGSPQVQAGQQFQPQQPQPAYDPRVDRLEAELHASKMQASMAQIEQFAKDPAHPHFETVRMEMGRMIEADPKLTLDDAYDRAVWLNPTIRSELVKSEAKRAADEAAKRAAAEAAKRTAAGSSVRDSASAAGSAPKSANGNDVLDDLMDAWKAVEG